MSTPIRQQYLRIKQEHPDAILFFRLGDFYETFDEDAKVASRELEIVLTSKPMGKNLRVPLAGAPVHSLGQHVARLVGRGYKVAICEQLEDPGSTKGLVERGIVRVITPGTATDESMLGGSETMNLASVFPAGDAFGIAYVELSTGEFATASCRGDQLLDELGRLTPREIIQPAGEGLDLGSLNIPVTSRESWRFEPQRARRSLEEYFSVTSLEGFGCDHLPAAIGTAGALLDYLQETQKATLGKLTGMKTYSLGEFMPLDGQTRRNLELLAGSRSGAAAGSLVDVLDRTRTAAGGRLLRRWLNDPLRGVSPIEQRLDGVEALISDGVRRGRLRDRLGETTDIARVAGRIRSKSATPRDLTGLLRSLHAAGDLQGQTRDLPDIVAGANIEMAPEVSALLEEALVDDPAAQVGEGSVFRAGFSDELDGFTSAAANARKYIAGMEERERERSGIKSLKVGFNRVFGYYLEVSNAATGQVPGDFIRKQTLVGAERYITPELKEYEAIVLNAQDRLAEIELGLYRRLLDQIDGSRGKLERIADWLATVDVLGGLAEVAVARSYVRPELVEEPGIAIKAGRHPVVESSLSLAEFVPNDLTLDAERRLLLLTGPNMAGKSTYLRQVALIVLLADVGSFVPADSARIGLVDRIFTRVGAQDDIAAGQSTFMVEMIETARILNHATDRSLVILDEIGRGTSTHDGLAIAQALVEHLHNSPHLRCRTLFATHYHELTELAEHLPGVVNATMAVAEEADTVVFLRHVIPGKADRSYGVHVAEMAGLPRVVTDRAAGLLATFESSSSGNGATAQPAGVVRQPQASLFPPPSVVIEELAAIDIDELTPLDALNRL